MPPSALRTKQLNSFTKDKTSKILQILWLTWMIIFVFHTLRLDVDDQVWFLVYLVIPLVIPRPYLSLVSPDPANARVVDVVRHVAIFQAAQPSVRPRSSITGSRIRLTAPPPSVRPSTVGVNLLTATTVAHPQPTARAMHGPRYAPPKCAKPRWN